MGISWIQVHSGRRSEVEVRAEAKEAAAAARGGQSEGVSRNCCYAWQSDDTVVADYERGSSCSTLGLVS